MDGLSLILVILTLLLGAIAVVSSWSEIEQRSGFFQANLLWCLSGVIGVFLAAGQHFGVQISSYRFEELSRDVRQTAFHNNFGTKGIDLMPSR